MPSFVHGNICSASKNLENNKIDFNIVGKSFFKKNTYIVQNHLNSKLNEIMLMNPTNKNLNITINDTNYDFLKWSTQLITIEKRIVKIKSNCYLIRPIIFSYNNDYLDVYHG